MSDVLHPLDALEAEIEQQRWHVGFAGKANIIRFDADDIVGVGYAPQPDALIEIHNKALDKFLDRLAVLRQQDTPVGGYREGFANGYSMAIDDVLHCHPSPTTEAPPVKDETELNFHAIIGPNGMCMCGVEADGTVVRCGDLLERMISERLSATSEAPETPDLRAMIAEIDDVIAMRRLANVSTQTTRVVSVDWLDTLIVRLAALASSTPQKGEQ